MKLQGLAAQVLTKSAKDEQVLIRCQAAKDLESAGEYEAARAEIADR